MPTSEDDGLESFDEENLDEEPEGEEEDVEAQQPEAAAPAPKANGAKRRKPRNDKGGTHKPPGEGWNSREAELMWPEILQRIPRMQPPKTPYDISVQVVRFSPQATTMPGAIEGSVISGGKGVSPGDALRRAIEDYYHLPGGRGPEEYEVRFVWKTTGRIIGRGRLSMASSEEIEGMRRAAEHMKRRRPYGGVAVPSPYEDDFEEAPPPPAPRRQAAAPGVGAVPVYPAPGGYAGFGAAPTAPQAPQANDEVGYLRQQVGYLSGQLQQLVGALTKGGVVPPQAPQAPTGFGASPAASQPDFEERMVTLLTRLGVIKTGVGATPPTSTNVASELHAGVSAFKTVVGLGRELRSLAKELNDVYDDGEGSREPPAETLVAEPVVTPPKPEDSLPFEVIPIPETNFLGHPAKYAVDKETGQFSREGFLMANPGLAEKALELGGRALEILGRLGNAGAGVAGAPQQQAAQVVSQIPAGAVDAGVAGNVAPQEPDGSGNNEGGL